MALLNDTTRKEIAGEWMRENADLLSDSSTLEKPQINELVEQADIHLENAWQDYLDALKAPAKTKSSPEIRQHIYSYVAVKRSGRKGPKG